MAAYLQISLHFFLQALLVSSRKVRPHRIRIGIPKAKGKFINTHIGVLQRKKLEERTLKV